MEGLELGQLFSGYIFLKVLDILLNLWKVVVSVLVKLLRNSGRRKLSESDLMAVSAC